MLINEFPREDFLAIARTRVTQQFFDKPIFDKYLQLLIRGTEEVQDVLEQIQTLRSIDTATGVQLDVIGDIVGYPRAQVTLEIFKYFGFQNSPNAGTYGSLNEPSVGSPWYSLGDPLTRSRTASDEEYRLMLKSKIAKNITSATPEQVIQAYRYLFGTSSITIDEYAPAKVRIGIGKILTPIERGLLFNLGGVASLLPKTLGVQYTYAEFQADRLFATDGYPGAEGWGDMNDPSVGGILANIITS